MNSKDSHPVTEATAEHCAYCFDVLIGVLHNQITKSKFPPLPPSIPKVEAPLFVTWHKDGDLRGCIGTFSKESIEQNLPEYTVVSAFQDTRFDPISKSEVSHLSCAVSLLTNFEKGKDAMDWEVGKHGISIELKEGGRRYRSTFLPEVAEEQGWDKETTLKYLLQKSGCKLGLEHVINKIELERYQSSKYELPYKEYLKLKEKKV